MQTKLSLAKEILEAEADSEYVVTFLSGTSQHSHATWEWDTLEQLEHDLDSSEKLPFITFSIGLVHHEKEWQKKLRVTVNSYNGGYTTVAVESENPTIAARIHVAVKDAVVSGAVPEETSPKEVQSVPKIFIGHGRTVAGA